jgi:hypothetical protein
MAFKEKLVEETRAIVKTTLYFAVCFVLLMTLKRLYLEDYQIEFRGISLGLLGAVVVAKVVLLMEYVPLGTWLKAHPAIVEVVFRRVLYSIGVFVVLLLERGFEARHEHGGFVPDIIWVIQHRDMHRVWADTIGVGCALFGFNALTVLQKNLGEQKLHQLFLSVPGNEQKRA